MSKNSAKQRIETLQGWISIISKRPNYPKKKVVKKKEIED